jgi:hypothetical protein
MRFTALFDDGDLEPPFGEKTRALDTTNPEPNNKDPFISGADII